MRRRLLTALIALAGVLGASTPALGDIPSTLPVYGNTAEFVGRVVDSNGQPVPGAEVRVHSWICADGGSCTWVPFGGLSLTEADGRFHASIGFGPYSPDPKPPLPVFLTAKRPGSTNWYDATWPNHPITDFLDGAAYVHEGQVITGFDMQLADQPKPPPTSPQPRSVSRVDQWGDPCQDVLFVGARGSGETTSTQHRRMGARVNTVFQGMLATISRGRVGYWTVIYPAQEVDALIWGTSATKKEYFNGLSVAVANVRAVLSRRAESCPEEKYVLAGYSQGAMAVHRALWDIENRRRIIGVILIADGDRRPRDGSQPLGTAHASTGITWRLPQALGSRRDARNAVLPAYFRGRGRVVSICDNGDVVCDFGSAGLAKGKRIHEQHYLGRGSLSAEAGKMIGLRAMKETPPL